MDGYYQQYLAWLQEHDENQDRVPFKEWLAATFPNDAALQNQLVVAEMVGGNLSKARAAQTLSDVTADADTDLQAGLTAIARTRLSRIANTMAFVDRVEDRLMRRINVEEASIDQLLAAGRLLRTSLKDDLTLVEGVVKSRQESKPEAPKSFSVSFTENVVNLGDQATRMTLQSRDSRDRARAVLEGMIRTVQKNGNPAEPAEPAA